jgi:hypothetical protein
MYYWNITTGDIKFHVFTNLIEIFQTKTQFFLYDILKDFSTLSVHETIILFIL